MESNRANIAVISQTPKPNTDLPPSQEFLLRVANLSDLPTMAEHNTKAYWNSPVHHHFLCPLAASYPEDMTRIFHQKLRGRLLTANNKTLVACLISDPSTIVGFAQFSRVGTDSGAKEFIQSRSMWSRFWTYMVLASISKVLDRASNFIWKDRITNFENLKEATVWFAKDEERYWNPKIHPERANRWQANSVVVAPEWQGRGVGRLLMGEVLSWAQRERVVVGLVSSPHGEHLYRKLGFEMLGDFYERIGEEEGGGIMIWYPVGWDGSFEEHSR